MSSPRSPKRRKILASINPPERDDKDSGDHRSSGNRRRNREQSAPSVPLFDTAAPRDQDHSIPPEETAGGEDARTATGTATSSGAPRVSKFRFKSKTSSHRSSRHRRRDSRDGDGHGDGDGDEGKDEDSSRRRHRHRSSDPSRPRKHHHHHRRRRKRTRSPSPAPAPQKQEQQPDDPFSAPLDPDVAFRESLFDAMADDEGAAYWESVYGQPIHVYRAGWDEHGVGGGSSGGARGDDPRGELERMTEDEYAAHVRQKMWEKTHAGLVEERARRAREREERDRREQEDARIRAEMERSLRRGEERRRRRERERAWKDRWEAYLDRWARWDGTTVEGIPWPVPPAAPAAVPAGGTGGGRGEVKGEDVEEDVRAFFVNGLGLEELGEKEFAARLKEERVRWHPDKMQQRLGGQVDAAVLRHVTAIFQVIDRLWNDTRKSSG